MKNSIAIRREDLSKRGEKRVAISPWLAREVTEAGHLLIVQPGIHPTKGTVKRAFSDQDYVDVGATISEDLSQAKVIFGLKEVEIDKILANKTYLIFSHTHKGQVKNRKMLKEFMDKGCSVVDYELVTYDSGARVITAFTYFAGYAGMIDTLWTVGKRFAMRGFKHPFSKVPQSIEKEDLGLLKRMMKEIGDEIREKGTPGDLPPFITVILGSGKTSTGAQEIYDLLPVESIPWYDLAEIFANGSRDRVYKCVMSITDMFRLKADAGVSVVTYTKWTTEEREQHYFNHPGDFESNLDHVLPYTTVLMNCILWSPEFPRTMPRTLTKKIWEATPTLEAIGDITCDPEGSIEFSKETWIDNPVFVYNPATDTSTNGFEGEGIAVMAVTNLPCEFSSDASKQFSSDMKGIIHGILEADHDAASVETSGLPQAVQRAAILWKGKFTEPYAYMADFVADQ